MAASRVLVVGSINCDITVRVPRLPLPNQTILGRESSTTIGGKGFNQAAAAVALGAEVRFVGAIGDDHFSDRIARHLATAGVAGDLVRTIAACPAGIAVITVDDAGNNAIAVSPGANARLAPDHVARAFAQTVPDVLLVQLESPIAVVVAALEQARLRGVTTMLNPAPAHGDILPYLPLVDILTPNEHELAELAGVPLAEVLAGGAQLDAALGRLQAQSGGTIVVTRGSAGAVAFDGKAFLRLPAFAVAAVDTTGAGDVFNGALAASIAGGDDLAAAMRKASAAAAISITRPSAEGSAPSLVEVNALIAGSDLL
jgi:ribokinase